MRLLVISSYPERSRAGGPRTVGGAWYARLLLAAMKEADPELEIEVLAEALDGEESYLEEGILVRRLWRRGAMWSLRRLASAVRRPPAQTVLLSLEMRMFGGMAHLVAALALLRAAARGKRVLLILHQVARDPADFETRLERTLFPPLARAFHRALPLLADAVVVHEEALRARLKGIAASVIPIPVRPAAPIDRNEAKRRLGLDPSARHVLCFGFLSPYKGVRTFLERWRPAPGVELLLCGGGNPQRLASRRYAASVRETLDLARRKGARTTGFLPEEEVPLYHSAADLVVLPHAAFISSSGPLSLAFTHERAVIFSRAAGECLRSSDLQEEAARAGLGPDDLCFDLDDRLEERLRRALDLRERLEAFSRAMKERRSAANVAARYREALHHLEPGNGLKSRPSRREPERVHP